MVKYTAKECSCWSDYPNEAYKKNNGQWKCVDFYELVKEGDWKHKTRCKLKEVKQMKLEKVIEVLKEQINKYGKEYDQEGIKAIKIAIKAVELSNNYKEDVQNAYDLGYYCGYADAMEEIDEEE